MAGSQRLRPEDLKRSHSNSMNTVYPNTISRGSVESMQPANTDPMFVDTTSFSSDFFPFEMSSRATPESTSTAASAPYASHQLQTPNQVNKLDSIMFPSEDPFAYPNQPIVELGFPSKVESVPNGSLHGQGQEAQYFYPGTMEEVDAQFLGRPPSYFSQGQQNLPQGQQNHSMMGMPNMFDPNSLMGFPPGMQPHQGSQQHVAQQQQQQQQQRGSQSQTHSGPPSLGGPPSLSQRRPRGQRRQERHIDQMFTTQGMQADWGGFFGSGRGGFQGM